MSDLTKDDLILLMDSYRNHFAMNQTLLSEITKIIDQQNIITQKQDAIISKQSKVCDKLQTCADSLTKANEKIDGMQTNVVKEIHEHSLESSKDHGSTRSKVYVGIVGMGLIVIGLIGLLAKVW